MFSSWKDRFENALPYFGYGSGLSSKQLEKENQELPKDIYNILEHQAFAQEQTSETLHSHKVTPIGFHQKDRRPSENSDSKLTSLSFWQRIATFGVGYLLFSSAQSSFQQTSLPSTTDVTPSMPIMGVTALTASLYASEPWALPLMFMTGLTFTEMVDAQSIHTTFLQAFDGSDHEIHALTINSEGDLYVAGTTASFDSGNADALLAKFSTEGTLLWANTLGGANTDKGFALTVTPEGDVIVAGYTTSFGAGGFDILLAKFASNGTSLWANTIGGAGNDYASALKISSEGDFFVTGGTSSFGAGSTDALLAKFSTEGTLIWAHTYGAEYSEYGSDLSYTSEGDLVITGSTSSFGSLSSGVLLMKLSTEGTLIWAKAFIEGGSVSSSIMVSTEGDLFITGEIDNSALLAKFSSEGTLLWANTHSVANEAAKGFALTATSEGDLILLGETYYSGDQDYNVLLVKCSSNGTELWTTSIGGRFDEDRGNALTITSEGDLFITGEIDNDALLAKLNVLGDVKVRIEGCEDWHWEDDHIDRSITPTLSDVTLNMITSTPSLIVQDARSVLNATDITNLISQTTECYTQTVEIVYGEPIDIVVEDQVVGTFTFTGGTGTLNSANMNTLTLNLNDDFSPEDGQEIILFTTSLFTNDEERESIEIVNNNKCNNGDGYEVSGEFDEVGDVVKSYSLIFETKSCTSTSTQTANSLTQSALSTALLFG